MSGKLLRAAARHPAGARVTLAIALLVAVITSIAGCGRPWRTDMWNQPSVRPEEAPRPEPEGSVPLGAGIHVLDRDDADTLLKDTVAADSASIQHGRMLFVQRCAACHGPDGHGGGPVSKLFPPAPDLAYTTVRKRSDGYLFGTITFGGRAMPPQPEGLTTRDRWDLVNLVRDIQRRSPVVAPPDSTGGGAPSPPPADSSATGNPRPTPSESTGAPK